jgi:hypothetical protein
MSLAIGFPIKRMLLSARNRIHIPLRFLVSWVDGLSVTGFFGLGVGGLSDRANHSLAGFYGQLAFHK